jgi:hypothetical protein
MAAEYPEATTAAKKKILGLNAARLYGIDVPQELRIPEPAATGMDVSDRPPVTA